MTRRGDSPLGAFVLAISVAIVCGCSLDRAGIGSTGRDASIDAFVSRPDAGDAGPDFDAGQDAGPIVVDGGLDGGQDGGLDGGQDGGIDGGQDGGPCGPCAAPFLCCGSSCVDPRIDPMHCGSCSPCPTGAHATATCGSSTCGLSCDVGWDDCDGLASDGCEADLGSLTSCGSCASVCTAPVGATATCDGTACGFTCNAGRADCDGLDATGCEVILDTDPLHCGTCTTSCGAGGTCTGGRCVGWTSVSTTGAPTARYDHSAIWTGVEMIVWGGQGATNALRDGFAYSPTTDSWRAITTTGAPSARRGHTAVWTGTEMVIWGGYSPTAGFLDDGAAYDPSTDTWRPMSATGAPSTRSRVPPIWTGNDVVIWGGWGGNATADRDDGARWRASTDVWSATASSGRPTPRRWHASVWTGTRMLVFSGEAGNGTIRNDGATYDPAGNTWSTLPTSGAPAGRARSVFVWAAGLATPVMIVWGGDGGSAGGGSAATVRNDGGRYDPAGGTWSATAAAPIAGRSLATAVWTGSRMIVWGGDGAATVLGDGASYDPVANTWSLLPATGAPAARTRHTAVWTGSEMIVFGGADDMFNPIAAPARFVP